jgi:phosphonoacetaldehyde hydrolase
MSPTSDAASAPFPVKAVIFDWAGTVIDFGCMAPVYALLDVFAADGVAITPGEARADMGRAKLDHLRAILAAPAVAERWLAAKAALPGEADVTRLYTALEPAMIEAAERAAVLIPGAADTVAALRGLGIKIGSGTGYTRAMMSGILPKAAAQGYAPDVVICAGETPSGRPSPQPAWAAMIALDVWPARACIKVDDAPVGIFEGREAGCWTVGIAASGNEVGLDAADFAALGDADRRARIASAAATLKAAGADYVIDDVGGLMRVVHDIAARIAAGG